VTDTAVPQHRTHRVLYDLVRHTAEQDGLPLRHPTRAHHDEICLDLLGDLHDLLGRVTGRDAPDLAARLDPRCAEPFERRADELVCRRVRAEVDV
jgi:hypothetical protein